MISLSISLVKRVCGWGRFMSLRVCPKCPNCCYYPLYTSLFTQCVLEERIHEVGDESVRLRTIHVSGIPDTLYMVEEQVYRGSQAAYHHTPQPQHSPSTATVDIIAGTIPGQ